MPLTPKTAAFLAMLNSKPQKRFEEMSLEELRSKGLEFSARFAAPKHEVASVEDRVIAGPHGDIPIRLYRPIKKENNGAVIFFNGSGFVFGSVEKTDSLTRDLANASGSLVVSVAYRSAPEHPYPIGLEDAFAATKWVVDSAKELKVDPDKIGVAGESSGGNFAALTAIHARGEGWPLAFQVLMVPVLDCSCRNPSHQTYAEGYLLDYDKIAWYFKQYFPENIDPCDPKTSPIFLPDKSGLPRTLIVTAEYDPLRDDGREYASQLRAAGVPVDYLCYPGTIHAFCNLRGALQEEEDVIQNIGQWIKNPA